MQGCFIDDVTGLRNRDAIGIDMITWECDYPHSDSTWPTSPEVVWKSLQAAALSDDEIAKVTWQNAARWYQFEPFEHRTREQSTVRALRAQATDVDTTPREYGEGEHTHNLASQANSFIGRSDMSNVGR